MADGAGGAQPEHGAQRGAADPGAEQGGEGGRHLVGQRGLDLVAYVGGDRDLQVPARVGAAGAAAQGESGGGQAFVGGVVVGGVEGHGAPIGDGGDRTDAGEVRQSARTGLVLPLDLAPDGRHAPNVVVRAAGGASRARIRCAGGVRYADMGRCTLIDWSSPTAAQTANMDEPP